MSAAFQSSPVAVEAEWTDYNGHLNMAYYHVLFDRAIDEALALLGLGPEVARLTGQSVFTAQAQVHYLRELAAGDRVVVETLPLAADAKRLHYVQTMRHADGWTAAVSENLVLHVDLGTRKVTPFAPDVARRIAEAVAACADLPRPPQVGRRVGVNRA